MLATIFALQAWQKVSGSAPSRGLCSLSKASLFFFLKLCSLSKALLPLAGGTTVLLDHPELQASTVSGSAPSRKLCSLSQGA